MNFCLLSGPRTWVSVETETQVKIQTFPVAEKN